MKRQAERKHVLVSPDKPRILCGFPLGQAKSEGLSCLLAVQAKLRNGRGVCPSCWKAITSLGPDAFQ